jgi:hypothetical protein
MSQRQYRAKRFVRHAAGKPILEISGSGLAAADMDRLGASIAEGEKHYCVVQLTKDRIWSLPIDLSYLYRDTGTAEFRAECQWTSQHALSPRGYWDALKKSDPEIIEKFAKPDYGYLQRVGAAMTYLRLGTDGWFQSAGDERNGKHSEYLWLKVFAYP